jgi:hypothetical protein
MREPSISNGLPSSVNVRVGAGTPRTFTLNSAVAPSATSVGFSGIMNLGADGSSSSLNTLTTHWLSASSPMPFETVT